MKAHLTLHFDGQDEQRLKRALQGELLLEVLEETLKHLFWWYHELHGKFDTNGYVDAFQFIIDALDSRGLRVEYSLVGKVQTLAGQVVEKTDADLQHVTGGPSCAEAAPAKACSNAVN